MRCCTRRSSSLVSICPAARIVALTRHTDEAFVNRMLEAGAVGYVLKQSASSELTRAVRAVAAGATYVDPSLCSIPRPKASADSPAAVQPSEPLTELEEHVLRLTAAAYSTQEIADHLEVGSSDARKRSARRWGN
jgi:DNA-binding NarL/FixJ family response regulator